MGTRVRIVVDAPEPVPPPEGGIEGLTEMESRRDRLPSAVWGADYLEDAEDNYTWQPETITWIDEETGAECWAVWRDKQGPVSAGGAEHAQMNWSHDGSRLGIISRQQVVRRRTNNPDVGQVYDYRWVVNADGTGLRACEGFGRASDQYGGFGWAATRASYFTFGGDSSRVPSDGEPYILYECKLDSNNVVTTSQLLDTSSIDTKTKRFGKIICNSDDTMMLASTLSTDKESLPTPNPLDCRELYFIQFANDSWSVSDHWGVARACGAYGNHTQDAESGWHDLYLLDHGDQCLLLYSGTNVWWRMDRTGSWAGDSGPEWTDWDGSAFGQIACEGSYAPTEYPTTYFGHPSMDRWGRFLLVGTYVKESVYIPGGREIVGTRVWDMDNNEFLPEFLAEVSDNGHHSFTAWSDYVIHNGRDGDGVTDGGMASNHYQGPPSNRRKVVNYHREKQEGDNENYLGLPRPSLSPDGTGANWQSWWLTSADGSIPYPAWCVHYYPYPARIGGATKPAGDVRIAFDPEPYTSRPWPDDQGAIPEPKEIKEWHLWVSTDRVNWSDATPNGIAFADRTVDYSQPNDTTYYYSITSREYKGLESRRLGNIWSVTLDGAGAITNTSESDPYPNSPGTIQAFYTTQPAAPATPTVATTGVATHRRLSWVASATPNVRYCNLYYRASGGNPTANKAYLFASIAASVTQIIDWQCENTGTDAYGITAVDYQGNESTIAIFQAA